MGASRGHSLHDRIHARVGVPCPQPRSPARAATLSLNICRTAAPASTARQGSIAVANAFTLFVYRCPQQRRPKGRLGGLLPFPPGRAARRLRPEDSAHEIGWRVASSALQRTRPANPCRPGSFSVSVSGERYAAAGFQLAGSNSSRVRTGCVAMRPSTSQR